MYKAKVDNKEVSVKDGIRINDELNEKLDSGTIQFLSEDGESNIDPFDSVVIKKTGARLPEQYQEVEYIESDGNQFLNVDGIYEGTKVLLDFELVGTNQEKAIIGGGWNANQFLLRVYNGKYEWYGNGVALTDAVAGVRTKVYLSHSKVKINGVEYNETDTKQGGHLILFGWKNEVNKCVSMKLYECKIFSTETRIEHLIPCYRKSDGRIGMYDIIGHMFFTYQDRNHPFTKGADVESGESNRTKLLVDNYNAEITNFATELKNSDFFYTTNLFSETKILERIVCPNLSHRHRMSGTQKTVAQVIKEICKTYLPRACYYKSTGVRAETKCILRYDEAIESKFNMECPEFTWNNATLREILTDLMGVADCMPIVKENILTFIDFNYRGKQIDKSKITNVAIVQASADYTEELVMPMQNVVQNKPTRIVEYITPKSIDTSEITTNNQVFITSKPINKIISCSVMYKYWDVRSGREYLKLKELLIDDFWFREEDEYNAMLQRKLKLDNNDAVSLYSAFFLPYKRGSNVLSGWGESIKIETKGASGFIDTKSKINWVLGAVREGHNATVRNAWGAGTNEVYGNNTRDIMIKLEYETIDETTVSIGRTKQLKHPENQIYDGQTSAVVNLDRQAKNEYSKVNRLGNKIYQIYGTYENESDVPQLADMMDDKILYSRSLIYSDNQIEFMGLLTENYILKDFFTGVNAKRRSWQIVSEKDATIRHDILKFYVVASFGAPQYINTNYSYNLLEIEENMPIVDILTGTNDRESSFELKGVAVRTADKDDVYYPAGLKANLVEFNTNVVSKSLVIDFGYIDNFLMSYVSADDDRHITKQQRYVDGNGEMILEDIFFCGNLNLADGEFNWDTTIEELKTEVREDDFDNNKYEMVLNKTSQKPVISLNHGYYPVQISKNLFKDNAEAIKNTIQFEYVSDTEDIIIGDKLVEYHIFNGKKTIAGGCRVYVLQNDKYTLNDKKARGTLTAGVHIYLTSDGKEVEVQDLPSCDAYCICDDQDNILLAVNDYETTIYFDIRPFRDNQVYNSQIDKVSIGKITDNGPYLDRQFNANLPEVDEIKVLNRYISIDATKDF